MPNVCTSVVNERSLIQCCCFTLPPWSRKPPPSWLSPESVDNSCGSHLPVWDVGYLMFSLSPSLTPLFPSLSLLYILCSVVSRTPSRITKTNSSLVVSCNLRKTRATISEHGTKFLTYTALADEYLILHYRDLKHSNKFAVIYDVCREFGTNSFSLTCIMYYLESKFPNY